jgi:hypothetical protein
VIDAVERWMDGAKGIMPRLAKAYDFAMHAIFLHCELKSDKGHTGIW